MLIKHTYILIDVRETKRESKGRERERKREIDDKTRSPLLLCIASVYICTIFCKTVFIISYRKVKGGATIAAG